MGDISQFFQWINPTYPTYNWDMTHLLSGVGHQVWTWPNFTRNGTFTLIVDSLFLLVSLEYMLPNLFFAGHVRLALLCTSFVPFLTSIWFQSLYIYIHLISKYIYIYICDKFHFYTTCNKPSTVHFIFLVWCSWKTWSCDRKSVQADRGSQQQKRERRLHRVLAVYQL